MTLSKTLRLQVASKLHISPRQLLNKTKDKAIIGGITDRDVALLLLAHERGINVNRPLYRVPREKLEALTQYLSTHSTLQAVSQTPTPSIRHVPSHNKPPKKQHLLKFGGQYPEIFYDRLENEINTAFSNPELPNAVFLLTRKLIENLVYNLLERRFGGKDIHVYYDTQNRRAQDFSVLVKNLADRKADFDLDLQDLIDKFLVLVHPFRRDANSKAHKVTEYIQSMGQLKQFQIPEMTQILLKLINRIK